MPVGKLRVRVDQSCQIFVGSVCPEIQHKAGGQAVLLPHRFDLACRLRLKSRVSGKRHNPDFGRMNGKVANEIVASGLGNGNDPACSAQGEGRSQTEEKPCLHRHTLRIHERRDVVEGQDGRKPCAVRHQVVRTVIERRPAGSKLSQKERDAPLLADVERRDGHGDGPVRQPAADCNLCPGLRRFPGAPTGRVSKECQLFFDCEQRDQCRSQVTHIATDAGEMRAGCADVENVVAHQVRGQ